MGRPRGNRGSYEQRLRSTYPKVDAGFREKALRSRLTARQQVRTLGRFCDQFQVDPIQLLTLARKDKSGRKEGLVGYAAELKKRNVQDAYIEGIFGTLKSWLRSNQVRFEDDELFPRLAVTRSVREERIPTSDGLRQILAHLSSRGRVCALLMAHSGLRPGVIGHYDGTDGLRLEDLPELDPATLEFHKLPFRILVPARLSKNHASFNTFGSAELASAVVAYLRERRDRFREKLAAESPLVSVARQVKFTGGGGMEEKRYEPKFVTGLNIGNDLRTALRRVFPIGTPRPYCLRSYFSSQMFVAEGNHRISATYREAMMGHTSGIDSVYNVRKGDHLVEDLRKAYAAAEEFLTTQQAPARDVETKRILDRMASLLGLNRDDLVQRLATMVGESSGERDSPAPSLPPRSGKRAEQIVRPMTELKTLLGQGYRFVQQVGSDAVFEVPNN